MKLLAPVLIPAVLCLGGCLIQMRANDDWENRGEFVLRGDVVDDNERPLQNVHMWVTRERVRNFFDDHGPFPERFTDGGGQIVGPTFSAEEKGCAGVDLHFSKEGYYSASVQHFATSAPDESERNIPPILRKPSRLRQENIHVVLEAVGFVPPHLTPAKVSPSYHPGTDWNSAIELVVPTPIWSLRPAATYRRLATTTTAPEGWIYTVAQTEPDGTISIEPAKARSEPICKSVKLAVGGSRKGDGFVRFVPATPEEQDYKVFFAMKQAPETGYQPELPVAHFLPTFFYFKIGNLYGKGQAEVDRVGLKDGRPVWVSVNLEALYREGDRDLRTRKDGRDYSHGLSF